MSNISLLAALAALLAVAPAADLGDPTVGVYSGRSGQLAVKIPRIDAGIAVDGTLNDPVWQRAALLTGFSEYSPLDGLPAEDSTEVFVWYSPQAMYFGVRAFDAFLGIEGAREKAREYGLLD